MPKTIPEGVSTVYLLPIGGTLAAPLAGLLLEKGLRVEGSDLPLYPPMSTLIASMGIVPRPGWDPRNIDGSVDLVIIGNAVPRSNPEVVSVLERDLCYASMPEALGKLVLAGRRPVVVAGTHGKTTTTSLAAWLLDAAGLDPGFLVGGVPIGFGTSYRLGSGAPFVIEGDEYNTAFFDRGAKFLHYAPSIAVITHVEFDHGDIYPDIEAIEREFEKLIALVPPGAAGGTLIACADAPRAAALAARTRPDAITYGMGEGARYRASKVEATEAGMRFHLAVDGQDAGDFVLGLSGEHNVKNALAALAAARACGASWERLREGLRSFDGVKRRLEERGAPGGVLVIDDFAHHPTAVRETLKAARLRYPSRRIHALFEPRSLTSGRNMFHDGYVEAFAFADRVSFAPAFHRGRLTEDQRLDFAPLAAELTSAGTEAATFPTIEALVDDAVAAARPGDVLLFMSSGSFGSAIERALAGLQSVGQQIEDVSPPRSRTCGG
ncbi:MAG: Mur ligase family protein [Acidobacteriota bacterium]